MISAAKPYLCVPIEECGERMLPIPSSRFAFAEPHPYAALGAPYGNASPWMLRESIVESLCAAQETLAAIRSDWKIKFYDAYRPSDVQRFMINREFSLQAKILGIPLNTKSEVDSQKLRKAVFSRWDIPSDDPSMPLPHETGAAFDVRIADERGHNIFMGSTIDENSERVLPDYYAKATSEAGKRAHAHRKLLCVILEAEGFVRHPAKWGHFSRGDQRAVYTLSGQKAIYGPAPL